MDATSARCDPRGSCQPRQGQDPVQVDRRRLEACPHTVPPASALTADLHMQTEEAAATSAHFHPRGSSQPQTGQQPGRAADAGSRPTHSDSSQYPHSRPPHVDRGGRCHVGAFPLALHPSAPHSPTPRTLSPATLCQPSPPGHCRGICKVWLA